MVVLMAGEDLGPPMVKFSRASGATENLWMSRMAEEFKLLKNENYV